MSKGTVCVTGGSGFVGSWVVREFLENGYNVHTTVRKIGSDSSKHVSKEGLKCPDAAGELQLFEADLEKEGSFDEAVKGCDAVIHTASPFGIGGTGKLSPEEKFINPAVNGTKNVLDSAAKTDSVRNVVVTSSVAAVAGKPVEGKVYDESDWNYHSTRDDNPYSLSKRMAEEKAWELHKENGEKWNLYTINPALIVGPSLSGRSNEGSFEFLGALLKGKYKVGAKLRLGIVDVRDVAKAHRLAMESGKPSSRYVTVAKTYFLNELADLLRPEFASYPLPALMAPKPLLLIFGPLVGLSRSMVWNSIGVKIDYSREKAESELGLEFRDPKQSMLDMANSMLEWGMVEKKKQ